MNPAPYKPSAFYFRTGLRAAKSKAEAVRIGMHLVAELEQLKEWVRSRDMVPPKWNIMQSEIDEKQWAEVVHLRTGN